MPAEALDAGFTRGVMAETVGEVLANLALQVSNASVSERLVAFNHFLLTDAFVGWTEEQ